MSCVNRKLPECCILKQKQECEAIMACLVLDPRPILNTDPPSPHPEGQW